MLNKWWVIILPPPFTPAPVPSTFIKKEWVERRNDGVEVTRKVVGAPSGGQWWSEAQSETIPRLDEGLYPPLEKVSQSSRAQLGGQLRTELSLPLS